MKKVVLIVLCICLCVSMLAGCAAVPAGDVDTSAPETSPSDTSTPQTSAPDTSLPEDSDSQPADSQTQAVPLQQYDSLADVPFADLSYGYYRGGAMSTDDTFNLYKVYYPTELLRDGASYDYTGPGSSMFAAGHPVFADEHQVFVFVTSVGSSDVYRLQRVGLDATQPQNYVIGELDGATVTVEDGLLCFSDGRRFDPQTIKWVDEGDGTHACVVIEAGKVDADWQPDEMWSDQYADWAHSDGDMPADTHGLQIYPNVEDVPHAALSLYYQDGSELDIGAGYEGVYAPKAIQKDGVALDAVSDPLRRYLPVGGVAASESEMFIITAEYGGGDRRLRRISLTDDHSGDYELAFEARPELFQAGYEQADMVIALSRTEGDVLYLCNSAVELFVNDERQYYYFGWDTVQKVWLIDGEAVAPIAGVDMLPLAG